MNLEELQTLIATGEGQLLEFKRSGTAHLGREICTFANSLGGLTLETLGTRSIPRNPLLFGMMHRMNLVEKVGSGLLRIRQMCEAYPCPQPRIEADADFYRIIFNRSEAEKPTAVDQVGTKSGPS